LNFGVDVGKILGIYFGTSSTVPAEVLPVMAIFEGMLSSLVSNGINLSDFNPTDYDAERMMKIFTKAVERGDVVDAGDLFNQHKYSQFGVALGEMISEIVVGGNR